MGRHKTISDRDILDVARDAFRRGGYAVSGREIARLAGVSEAVLYQRFKSKDALFFAAMAPTAPDILNILGPKDPPGEARVWIRNAVERIAVYFEELLPLAVQVTMHPGSELESGDEAGHVVIADRILQELALRLRSLQKRGAITDAPYPAVARLLIGMAHDWALHRAVLARRSPGGRPPLSTFVDLAWHGIAPAPGNAKRARARKTTRRSS
jgi:AcrR family transcriptional regulator